MRRQEDPTRSATVYPRGLRSSHLQVGPDRQDRLFPLAWTLLEPNAELAQQPLRHLPDSAWVLDHGAIRTGPSGARVVALALLAHWWWGRPVG